MNSNKKDSKHRKRRIKAKAMQRRKQSLNSLSVSSKSTSKSMFLSNLRGLKRAFSMNTQWKLQERCSLERNLKSSKSTRNTSTARVMMKQIRVALTDFSVNLPSMILHVSRMLHFHISSMTIWTITEL